MVAIVAIPSERDPVWKYSSVKVPHMTLLHLGKDVTNLSQIIGYVEHVCSSVMPFGMSVEDRGTLGPDNADVLFFAKDKHGYSTVSRLRQYLLDNENVKKAYESVDQYPEWTPHLTMGYPATPAKPDNRDYPGFSWIDFDRIAIWTDDYSGPEIKLNYPELEEVSVVMGEKVDDFLEHFGVKGMKWGIRKEDAIPAGEVRVTQKKPGARVTTAGGHGVPAHPDAIKAATAKQKAKVSTTDSLSNKELQDLVTRLNLEQQYSRLTTNQKGTISKGNAKIKEILDAKNTVDRVLSDPNVKPFVNKMAKDIFDAIRK